MNKIEDAIYTVHEFDNKSNEGKFLNNIHPLIKLIITVIYILLLTSINKYDLLTTIAMGIYLILISIIGDLSIKNCIKRLKPIFILLIVIGIANPILDRTLITKIGQIPITNGMISMTTLILKGFFTIISSYFLIITTSIEKICSALKMIHVPNILITVFMLIYRYIMVFLKEVERIWTAYSLRAPKQKGVNYKVWGSMIGSLMIRSINKSETVYESMELRGFNPDKFFTNNQKFDKISVTYLIVNGILIITLRFIPVLEIVGNIFI